MTKITNYYEHQASGNAPDSVVILCHGLGSNGQDLISLAPYWAEELPDTRFISPDAPFRCDMVPPGYPDSYQWFSLLSRDPQNMLEGVKTAAPILMKFMDDMRGKFSLPAAKIALVGFSQGTMLSLYVGPHYPEKIAGILGYSGALIRDPGTDYKTLRKPPICLIHGEADDVVPVGAYYMARPTLETDGFDVTGHTTPDLPHSIDAQGIETGLKFLKKILTAS